MIILVVLAYMLVLFLDLVPLYKDKLWKDFWTNTALSSISFIVAVLLSLNVRIPSPAKPIKNIIMSVFGK